VFRDLETYPKLVGGLSEAGEQRAAELYRSFLQEAEVWPMGGAEAAELAKLAETTYRDLNIAFANELARPPTRAASTSAGHRRGQLAAVQPHPPPGVAVGGHCIPSTRGSSSRARRTAQLPARRATSTTRCPPTRSTCSATSTAGACSSSASPTAAASRRTRSAARWPCGACSPSAARRRVQRPALQRRRAARRRLRAVGRRPVDAAIVQADHAEYRELSPGDLPGVAQIVDGRGVLDLARFDGVPVRRIGRP
jgi:UDP-N-acetyl-D-mannosaminuronic acid dehydrogenase